MSDSELSKYLWRSANDAFELLKKRADGMQDLPSKQALFDLKNFIDEAIFGPIEDHIDDRIICPEMMMARSQAGCSDPSSDQSPWTDDELPTPPPSVQESVTEGMPLASSERALQEGEGFGRPRREVAVPADPDASSAPHPPAQAENSCSSQVAANPLPRGEYHGMQYNSSLLPPNQAAERQAASARQKSPVADSVAKARESAVPSASAPAADFHAPASGTETAQAPTVSLVANWKRYSDEEAALILRTAEEYALAGKSEAECAVHLSGLLKRSPQSVLNKIRKLRIGSRVVQSPSRQSGRLSSRQGEPPAVSPLRAGQVEVRAPTDHPEDSQACPQVQGDGSVELPVGSLRSQQDGDNKGDDDESLASMQSVSDDEVEMLLAEGDATNAFSISAQSLASEGNSAPRRERRKYPPFTAEETHIILRTREEYMRAGKPQAAYMKWLRQYSGRPASHLSSKIEQLRRRLGLPRYTAEVVPSVAPPHADCRMADSGGHQASTCSGDHAGTAPSSQGAKSFAEVESAFIWRTREQFRMENRTPFACVSYLAATLGEPLSGVVLKMRAVQDRFGAAPAQNASGPGEGNGIQDPIHTAAPSDPADGSTSLSDASRESAARIRDDGQPAEEVSADPATTGAGTRKRSFDQLMAANEPSVPVAFTAEEVEVIRCTAEHYVRSKKSLKDCLFFLEAYLTRSRDVIAMQMWRMKLTSGTASSNPDLPAPSLRPLPTAADLASWPTAETGRATSQRRLPNVTKIASEPRAVSRPRLVYLVPPPYNAGASALADVAVARNPISHTAGHSVNPFALPRRVVQILDSNKGPRVHFPAARTENRGQAPSQSATELLPEESTQVDSDDEITICSSASESPSTSRPNPEPNVNTSGVAARVTEISSPGERAEAPVEHHIGSSVQTPVRGSRAVVTLPISSRASRGSHPPPAQSVAGTPPVRKFTPSEDELLRLALCPHRALSADQRTGAISCLLNVLVCDAPAVAQRAAALGLIATPTASCSEPAEASVESLAESSERTPLYSGDAVPIFPEAVREVSRSVPTQSAVGILTAQAFTWSEDELLRLAIDHMRTLSAVQRVGVMSRLMKMLACDAQVVLQKAVALELIAPL